MRRIYLPVVFLILVIVLLIVTNLSYNSPIRVGIIHSTTGTMAISEKSVLQATLHAIDQINADGGLLGTSIEPIIVDSKSDPEVAAREAARLIEQENVSAIFGCWTSACRKSVKQVVEHFNHILFYPLQYEGLENSTNVIYTGAAPNQQLIPAVTWAIQNIGSKIYLIGSDYVFPHVANHLIKRQVALLEGEITGESYVSFGATEFELEVKKIRDSKPDIILNTINGDSNIAFFRELDQAGLDSKTIPVLSFSIAEPELKRIDSDLSGHYVAWNYFESLDTPVNKVFVTEYRKKFGSDVAISDPMVSAWAGVQLWATAVKAAQTAVPDVVMESVRHASLHAPMGIIAINHHNYHVWKTPRIGKIESKHFIREVWHHSRPIRPEPFPLLIRRNEVKDLMEYIHQQGDKYRHIDSGKQS